jgi:hypothetical protein
VPDEDLSQRGAVGSAAPGNAGCTAANIFALLWDTLSDLLGPATTATLLRRCVKYSMARYPMLERVTIRRESFQYHYDLPANWSQHSEEAWEALRALMRELWRVLVPLTDQVVVRRLGELAAFTECGLVPPQESR